MRKSGPLAGIRIVEFGGIGPGPYCGMLLADLGADVLLIDRPGGAYAAYGFDPRRDFMQRGKSWITLDLKQPEDLETALALIGRADAVIESSRPGVAERRGFGPADCLARNPALVYGRVTGWGQDGPYAQMAGHDINYIAISGVLDICGRPGEPPAIPHNFVGDMGGGGLLLAFGIVSAILEARQSGQGQVVDAAMIEGAASQLSGLLTLRAMGQFDDRRGHNSSCGAAPFYETYRTADDKYIAVGCIEPQFYAAFRQGAGLDDPAFDAQWDEDRWPAMKAGIAARIVEKTRAEWMAIFDADACVAPVMGIGEAASHPQNAARKVFMEPDGMLQPAPVPRFSRTPGAVSAPPTPGADTGEILRKWGVS